MSVFLEDYCKGTQTEMSRLLKKCWDDAIFIGSDEIDIRKDEWDCTVAVYVQHSITCNDIHRLLDIFSGLYWRIMTSFNGSGFEVLIDVTEDMIFVTSNDGL